MNIEKNDLIGPNEIGKVYRTRLNLAEKALEEDKIGEQAYFYFTEIVKGIEGTDFEEIRPSFTAEEEAVFQAVQTKALSYAFGKLDYLLGEMNPTNEPMYRKLESDAKGLVANLVILGEKGYLTEDQKTLVEQKGSELERKKFKILPNVVK